MVANLYEGGRPTAGAGYRRRGSYRAQFESRRHNQAMSHTAATVEPSQLSAGCDAVTAVNRQGVNRARDHVEDRRLAARARYAAPAAGLPPGTGLLPMGFCCATSPVVAGIMGTDP